jgi:16S rRNA (cytosine967-C5)-methyltransferase
MMKKTVSARDVALDVLLQVEQHQAYSNLALNQALYHRGLDARDKRLATELIYGTVARLNTLDWIGNRLVKNGLRSLQPWVRQLVRMSLYQLCYLDKIPERAAVHEAVQIAKRRGHRGISSLVNGVLRSYLRRQDEFRLPDRPATLKEKALRLSHPEWMVKRMEEVYGAAETEQALLSNLTPPKVSVRVNQLKLEREAFIEQWNQSGLGEAAASPLAPEGVVIQRGGNPAFSPLFREGLCTIQDESSMLVSRILHPQPGMRVLDACAAPGGKTTHLAELMQNQGTIVACDIHAHKLELIRSNADRLGIGIIAEQQTDAREASASFAAASFDAILLDAPCSGLGVIRRKPDIKWSKEAQAIEPLVKLQRELLEEVASLLKPGGVLVYSTCTWEPRENREQVEAFVKRHPEFKLDSAFIQDLAPVLRERAVIGDGWIQLLPHHFGSDGFFIARMHKIK